MIVDITGVLRTGAVPTDGSAPLAPSVQPVSWAVGSDGYIRITVVDETGSPVNLAGCAVSYCVKRRTGDAMPTINRAAMLTDPSHGVAMVPLVGADTINLERDIYRGDAWIVDGTGARAQIVLASNFSLEEIEQRPSDSPTSAGTLPPTMWGAVDTVNTTGTTLAAVDASQLGDGTPMWVRETGQGYWHIEIGKGYPIDATHIAALGLAGGQWVQGLGPNSGGSSGATAVAIDFDNFWETETTQPNEEIIGVSKYIDFDEEFASSVTNLIPRLTATAFVTGGTGTVTVYVGGTFGNADGTLVATGTLTATDEAVFTFTGESFAKPAGLQLVQISIENDTSGQRTAVDSPRVTLRSA